MRTFQQRFCLLFTSLAEMGKREEPGEYTSIPIWRVLRSLLFGNWIPILLWVCLFRYAVTFRSIYNRRKGWCDDNFFNTWSVLLYGLEHTCILPSVDCTKCNWVAGYHASRAHDCRVQEIPFGIDDIEVELQAISIAALQVPHKLNAQAKQYGWRPRMVDQRWQLYQRLPPEQYLLQLQNQVCSLKYSGEPFWSCLPFLETEQSSRPNGHGRGERGGCELQ